jgi:cystathionine beta-lyase
MPKNWKTKLIHSDLQVPRGFPVVASPVFKCSYNKCFTVVFPSAAAVTDSWNQYEAGQTYGLYGTPTALELAGQICEPEHGYRTILTPCGQAAISLVNFALLEAG